MDRKKQIAALAESDAERQTLIRACERMERAREHEQPSATAFLSPREQALMKTLLPWCLFWGGAEGAERAVAYYVPEYMTRQELFDGTVIACLRGSFYQENALSHRDVLGALMGAGLRRDAVGDIYIHEKCCEFFVLAELKQYLLDNLTSAGRHALKLTELAAGEAERPEQTWKELNISVASLRLDGVIAGAFRLSRGAAAEAIRAGAAAVNSLTCQKPDREIGEGDELSLRGHGKLKVLKLGGTTRRGRLAVQVGIYQ